MAENKMNNGLSIGLRFLATIIDLSICLGMVALSFELLNLIDQTSAIAGLSILFIGLPIALTSPILYLGISTGLWGRTIGKLLCRLRVENERGGRLGFWKGIGREAFKVFLLFTHFGALIAAVQILLGRKGFHDSLCGTDVEFIGGLTSTQRAWRRSHGRY